VVGTGVPSGAIAFGVFSRPAMRVFSHGQVRERMSSRSPVSMP
jgi:hypothetical protein